MNKPQRFFVLLWIMATLAAGYLAYVVTDDSWMRTYGLIYAAVTALLWGMVWVMADRKPAP